jgi:fatty acid desaturase
MIVYWLSGVFVFALLIGQVCIMIVYWLSGVFVFALLIGQVFCHSIHTASLMEHDRPQHPHCKFDTT